MQTAMSKEEALKQIQEINSVIESSHQFLISGTLAILYGIAVLFFPAIELLSKELTFGLDYGPHHLLIKSMLHVMVYATLFLGIKFILEKLTPHEMQAPAHPVLVHAFAFHRPIVLASTGTILVLGSLNLEPLVPAFIFIYFGILFNYYGRLSHSLIRQFSWTYIVAGLALAYCTRFNIPNLWMYFSTYLGITFIVIGIQAKKEKKNG